MERLTIKNNDGSYSQPTHTTFNKLFEKLSKLEDVLEKYGIESAEELENYLSPKLFCYAKLSENLDELEKYYQSEPFIHIDTCEPQIELITDKVKDLKHQLAVKDNALKLAVADKCKFENALLSTSLGIVGGKVAVPKKEQWYIEQAENELKGE